MEVLVKWSTTLPKGRGGIEVKFYFKWRTDVSAPLLWFKIESLTAKPHTK